MKAVWKNCKKNKLFPQYTTFVTVLIDELYKVADLIYWHSIRSSDKTNSILKKILQKLFSTKYKVIGKTNFPTIQSY